MRNLKTTFCFTLMLTSFAFFIGCAYDAVLPEQPPKDEVSFNDFIVPNVFNPGCNTAGCHSGPADFQPDLTPANAYSSLLEGNYVDTLNPENSVLYQWMLGNEGAAMPPSGTDAFYNASILKWISEGAQDN
jgi:hypothetical protein